MTPTHTEELHSLTAMFQALSDETRLQIVARLRGGEQCVCDLQAGVGSYQSRLSFHLKKLKEAGLVTDRRVGRWVYYALRPDALAALQGFLSDMEPMGAPCCTPPVPGCCG
jgi:ArsR family transcriptional regulator, arsenate/arsenite/antimonite-responsive transcriptional repressor